jgi:hypothetical protein
MTVGALEVRAEVGFVIPAKAGISFTLDLDGPSPREAGLTISCIEKPRI